MTLSVICNATLLQMNVLYYEDTLLHVLLYAICHVYFTIEMFINL